MDTHVAEIDEALKLDRQRLAEREAALQRAPLGRFKSLPQVLRTAGTVVILAAAAAFMVQQWSELGHIVRYYYFLGFTLALTLAGLFCGTKWKEDKGARTFLGIAAAIIPVHFAQLGGLIYSRTTESLTLLGDIPTYFRWVAPDMVTAVITSGIGVAALSVVALVAFLALCRSEARSLTASYVALNMLLLVPSRDATLMGIVGAGAFLALASLDLKLSKNPAVKTTEGTFIRTMMTVPLCLLIARGIFLYPTTAVFYSLLFAASTVFLAFFAPHYVTSLKTVKSMRALSTVTAAIALLLANVELLAHYHVAHINLIPLATLPYCAYLLLLSFVAPAPQGGYRKFASILALAGAVLELCIFPGLFPTGYLVVISILTLAYAYTEEQKTPFVAGAIGLVFGLLYHIRYAYEIYAIDGWVSLALLGMATIFVSSFMERNHRELLTRVRGFHDKFKTWN